jgi:hypothetical protein
LGAGTLVNKINSGFDVVISFVIFLTQLEHFTPKNYEK